MLIREARDADAEGLTTLIVELGYDVTAEDVARRVDLLLQRGTPPLVAEEDGLLIGCLTWDMMPVLHRDTQVGRISMLVVTAAKRSGGIGAKLVAEAEARMAALGCTLVEVTSGIGRDAAHRFYERVGYGRTSIRFGKEIG